MRAWDIVDEVYPGVSITTVQAKSVRFVGRATSAIRVAIAVAAVVATSASFNTTRTASAVKQTTRVQVIGDRRPPRPVLLRSRRQRVASITDTQLGQSTFRLSRVFTTYFQPALNEDTYEDDYSF